MQEAWRRGEEEGFETVHQLAEAQTDLATVRDAMEATVGTEGAGGSSVTGSHILRV